MIALVIMAIMAGVSAVVFIGTSSSESLVISDATMLQSTLQGARSSARQDGVAWRVLIEGTPVVAQVYQADTTGDTWVLDELVTLNSLVAMQSNALSDNQVVFDTTGAPYEDPRSDPPSTALTSPLPVSNSIVLTHAQNASLRREIVIYPQIGFIELIP